MAKDKKKKKKKSAAKAVSNTNAVKKGLPPIKNPELEEAMANLKANSTPETQQALFKAVKEATLIAPCDFAVEPKPDGNGGMVSVPGNQIKFFLVTAPDGKNFFPVFTDFEKGTGFKVNGVSSIKLVTRKVTDYDSMLSAPDSTHAGLVINPGIDNVILPKALIHVLATTEGVPTPVMRPAGSAPVNVTYSEPAKYPTRMVNAVFEKCRELETVSRVWLKSRTQGTDNAFALFVEAEDLSTEVSNAIIEAAQPQSPDVPVVVVPYSEEIEEKVIQGAFPLYDKELDF